MILNKGDIFMASGVLYISDEYVNTEVESWRFECINYNTKRWNQIHTSQVDEVFKKQTHPEYYL